MMGYPGGFNPYAARMGMGGGAGMPMQRPQLSQSLAALGARPAPGPNLNMLAARGIIPRGGFPQQAQQAGMPGSPYGLGQLAGAPRQLAQAPQQGQNSWAGLAQQGNYQQANNPYAANMALSSGAPPSQQSQQQPVGQFAAAGAPQPQQQAAMNPYAASSLGAAAGGPYPPQQQAMGQFAAAGPPQQQAAMNPYAAPPGSMRARLMVGGPPQQAQQAMNQAGNYGLAQGAMNQAAANPYAANMAAGNQNAASSVDMAQASLKQNQGQQQALAQQGTFNPYAAASGGPSLAASLQGLTQQQPQQAQQYGMLAPFMG